MDPVRLYLDEDAMQLALVSALRARRIDIVTALDAGLVNKSDETHLVWATEQNALYILSTFGILLSCMNPGIGKAGFTMELSWRNSNDTL